MFSPKAMAMTNLSKQQWLHIMKNYRELMEKYDKYFYFRDVGDEDHDDDVSASITIPVNDITGVVPSAITTLDIYYNSGDKTVPNAVGGTAAGTGKVALTPAL